MDNHTDGFCELEFQRLYIQQGRVLKRIRLLENQLKCYINKYNELQARGITSLKLKDRIYLTIDRLKEEYALRDGIEFDKEAVSLNNPKNAERAADAKVISDAYERAYAPVPVSLPTPVQSGIWNAVCKFICGRSK